jgi:predicted flap endonuclease-1-like 5' DNA nuclease
MKGDFSSLRFDRHENDQGVLYQQGRVTLDADLTAAELIALHWRTRAARDVIGTGVAAVPTADPDGFRVESAAVVGGEVHVRVHPGRIWADGVLLYLPGEPPGSTAPVDRAAPYLDPPLDTGTVGDIGDGVRDVVVLEVALEELNAFQEPERLLEPALGGPDTAERITARYDFRLLRLAPGEDCRSVLPRLHDGPEGKGRLTASLDPPVTLGGDCPTVEGGGYTGFEHNLYRVEIADVSSGAPRFKWSQFNGGLVGRGVFQAGPPRRVVITANRAAIVNSGLTDFYLEALAYDGALGRWRVVYGAPASLDDQLELELADPPVFGAFAFGAEPVFFRLWNGIEPIADFTASAPPAELRDGIRLRFDPPASATYRPGDYWTFPVRAGEIANPETLVDDAPPRGPVLRRVPLAEIEWTGRLDTTISGAIEDCRRRFPPLTDQKTCCTLRVGDGVRTFGDFDSLEEAALHLPASGGELCLLPGLHFANLVLRDRANVRIHGCARRTMVLPRPATPALPIVSIQGGGGIEISDLDLVSFFGPLVVATASETRGPADLRVHDCRMLARTCAVSVERAEKVVVARNELWLLDTPEGRSAIRLGAVGALVERNSLGVRPFREPPGDGDGGEDGGGRPEPPDPCEKPDRIYATARTSIAYAYRVWTTRVLAAPVQPYRAWGGIHLLGGSEEVRVLENHVDGGAGHGVTLGGLLPGESPAPAPGEPGPAAPTVVLDRGEMTGYVQDEAGAAVPDVDVYLSAGGTVAGQGRSDANGAFRIKIGNGTYAVSVEPGWEIVALKEAEFEGARYYVIVVRRAAVEVPEEEGFLYRISLEENEIERMGLSGVGFRPFAERGDEPLPEAADPTELADVLSTRFAPRDLMGTTSPVRELVIRANRIHHNLRAVFDDELRRAARTVGQGGISLALVETALIEDNEVLDNGLSAVSPTCGIFVAYGEDVEIRGNRVAGNGPVGEDYDGNRLEGLRGGVFVRFAVASLLGGEADAHQKPALRVVGNRIDQPAGRALTALAFGPVAVLGNYLNSEREGRWSIIDTLVGGALILNLGGLHRQMRFEPPASDAFEPNRLSVSRAAFRDTARAEALLPGGETLFDDNQMRLGPGHRSRTAALLVTLDDLGFDGNQLTAFPPEILFANAVCVGFSLRATDSSFRERARACYFSLLSSALGLTAQGRLLTMNTTALNQGDHCIVALSNASPGGPPVVDRDNLEGNAALCRRLAGGDLRAYLTRAAGAALYTGGAAPETAELGSRAKLATEQAALSVGRAGAEYRRAYARETARLGQRLGTESPRVQTARSRLAGGEATLRQLEVEAELTRVREASAPQGGALVDGRVMDVRQRGQANATVELVHADDTPVGLTARTDDAGYFALALEPEQAKRLEAEGDLFVRVTDPQGKVLQRSATPVRVATDASVRTEVVLPAARVPASVLTRATEIFRRAPSAPPRTSTPLESVRGIGPKTAEKLRAAGIPDLEALLRTPGARLVDVAGFDADVMRERAREAVSEAARAKRGRGRGTERSGDDG